MSLKISPHWWEIRLLLISTFWRKSITQSYVLESITEDWLQGLKHPKHSQVAAEEGGVKKKKSLLFLQFFTSG